MKKKYFFALCLLFSLLNNAFAQKATFHVIDAETHQDIEGVVIHSRFEKNQDLRLKTDVLGSVTIHVALDDTISFEHQGFYLVHIIINHHKNYDFTHPIKVYMTSLAHESHQKSVSNFEDFETTDYHFSNDGTKKKNAFKITVLESSEAAQKRLEWLQTTRDKYETGFNIIDIKLSSKKKKE